MLEQSFYCTGKVHGLYWVLLQDTNGGVHIVIWWLLLGSYVCFITTSLDAVIQIYCWDYVQLVQYQTTAADQLTD